MKLGHIFRFACAVLAIAVGAVFCASSTAQEHARDANPARLEAGSQAAFTLAPGAEKNVRVSVGGGEAVTVGFEQVAGALSVTGLREGSCAGCPRPDPRSNAAGTHSSISFRLIGNDASENSFALKNPSKTRAAEVVASVSPAHPAGEDDRREADAEASLARAEALRAKRDPASVEAATAAYDHAIAIWREAGDTADLTRALAWKAMLLGFVKNNLAGAQAVAKQALGSVDALHGREAANCWKIAGYIAAASSDYEAAEKDYTAAIALFKATGDRLNQEILLDNQAKLAIHFAAYSRFDAGAESMLPPLRFAEQEAAFIVSIYGSGRTTVMTGVNASADSVGTIEWGPFSVAHFATHAVVDQRHAEFSGLLLSGSGQDDRDGRSSCLPRYEEISRLHAPLELVVLSACDTANGEQVPGEGLLGLSHAFMAAGSQRVLGTLWTVDDEATAAWMGIFYRSLKESGSPGEALQKAQVKMAAEPRWHSPFYWAGFSLEGNWHAMR